MAMKKEAAPKSAEIEILEIKQGAFTVGIISNTPMIMHRFSDKARQELLMPPPKKNAAARQSTLKHEPIKEARGCAYTISDNEAPTFFGCPAMMLKNATASAALDIPGATKAAIGRLVYIEGEYPGDLIPFYGTPFLFCTMVRNSDPGRTPDVRTRIIFPRWAMKVTVKFIQPNLSAKSVYNLLNASGMIDGIGDWRQEKGKGSYGRFSLCDTDDPEFLAIMRDGERDRQKTAFETMAAYDDETRELLQWYDEELARRGHQQETPTNAKKKRNGVVHDEVGIIQ